MDIFEEPVMPYLTRDGETFVAPQSSIKDSDDAEWGCPDFVALSPKAKSVAIVEVSAAFNPGGIERKIRDRVRWFEMLRNQLASKEVIDLTWKKFSMYVFVRTEAGEKLRSKFGQESNVKIENIEHVGTAWAWDKR